MTDSAQPYRTLAARLFLNVASSCCDSSQVLNPPLLPSHAVSLLSFIGSCGTDKDRGGQELL